jgi:hypothetical protein
MYKNKQNGLIDNLERKTEILIGDFKDVTTCINTDIGCSNRNGINLYSVASCYTLLLEPHAGIRSQTIPRHNLLPNFSPVHYSPCSHNTKLPTAPVHKPRTISINYLTVDHLNNVQGFGLYTWKSTSITSKE